jgi:hypothetical protein
MNVRASKGVTGRRSIEKIIGGIFELDGGVRFVAVYQDQYLLAGGMRKGVDAYDPTTRTMWTCSWRRWARSLESGRDSLATWTPSS